MPLVAFKLFITPMMICSVYFAGRRWGEVVSGFLIGLPLTSGPISLILAYQYGADFAARAAIGNLAGQISICSFCLAYYYAAKSSCWLVSTGIAISAFVMATYFLHGLAWGLITAFCTLMLVIALTAKFMPQQEISQKPVAPPWWDLPARIVIAICFMVALTSVAGELGPELSGLIAPFPIFAIVFAAFTHRHQGAAATGNLLRGIVLSSIGYAFFFLTVGEGLTRFGIAWTYLLAALLAIGSSAAFYGLRMYVNSKFALIR
jgi:uncharacterized membrane protein (UPF0136 family)